MIQNDNFRAMLLSLGFSEQKQVLSKFFPQFDGELKVDFVQEKLIYPEDKGLTINERQTCNFSSAENAVVFECVYQLLNKGYKPEHIELEPKWKVGHGASGGRADILVKDQQNTPLLIIECKTFGKEFDKAWKDTLADGAQLFSYIEQEKATQFVCLYASEFDQKSNTIKLQQRIISAKDNAKILQDNPKLASFAQADNNKQRFKVWKETYQQEFTETGLFEENILPYHIGKEQYTLAQDTKTIDAMDIKGAYHRFRTILRKHNVSRRENAFEVLVNLFLCKIVDEIQNPDNLKFYWKGIAYDNYFDLVDRLQSLYKTGMEQFLNQEIVYISNDEIDKAFWAIKQKPNATEQRIKELFRQLKFYKGLDFEFIKVFNKSYFDKNAKILLEIIQMWQGLRLTNSEQNQFLGDMFEYFLDNGIKQSEGQFFTPVPICKFIVSALPLEQLIESHSEAIKAIDYACGSGHFLTEYAQQIPSLIKEIKQLDNPSPYYQQIYGIEKEDRLAKVAKVSAFMYGRKEIQIIDADALVPHQQIKEASFDVLIANPPFAVEDFLLTVDEEDREKYTLINTVNDLGNKNIQCFFLERAQQLLSANGVMGVIVPSSVLSNSDTMHIATREILLKYFDFISITELGNNTFGKTGTNTVILFLRRKAQRPEAAEQYKNRVQNFFDNWVDEVASAGGAYLDVEVVRQYCAHIGIDYAHYQSLLLGKANDELLAYEMFKDYRADFDNLTDIKKLKDNKAFKAKTATEQTAELEQRFNQYLQAIEQNKLYYFMLAHNNPCPVVLVKSPADNKEQKKFLGYEWSGAKGSEGIVYNGGDTVYDINTPMFDPKD
ncbi:MAG: restriction endonuclease subunit M, partial [Pseudomonadales bacterium]|nr:restriction endonuclease subunit M [Pseudomonadales bacterium]